MSYINRITSIADEDCVILRKKDKEYGGSWLKRGGVGAFMMLARKWDRLEQAMKSVMMAPKSDPGTPPSKYDIIERALVDYREEGILDDIGDLRRYLLLVEAEIRERLKEPRLGALVKADPPIGNCFDGPQSIH